MTRAPDPYHQTFTGRMVRLDAPRPEEIDWLDVAMQLARIPRFLGATRRVYSVAEHQTLVEKIAAQLRGEFPGLRAYALLHDAHEFAVGDWTTPAKRLLTRVGRERFGFSQVRELIKAAIDPLDRAIRLAAGLPAHQPVAVECAIEIADKLALFAERAALMEEPPQPWAEEPDPADAGVIAHWAGRIPQAPQETRAVARDWLDALLAAIVEYGGPQEPVHFALARLADLPPDPVSLTGVGRSPEAA